MNANSCGDFGCVLGLGWIGGHGAPSPWARPFAQATGILPLARQLAAGNSFFDSCSRLSIKRQGHFQSHYEVISRPQESNHSIKLHAAPRRTNHQHSRALCLAVFGPPTCGGQHIQIPRQRLLPHHRVRCRPVAAHRSVQMLCQHRRHRMDGLVPRQALAAQPLQGADGGVEPFCELVFDNHMQGGVGLQVAARLLA